MPIVNSALKENDNICLWRLAVSTVVRTALSFAIPYVVAYYSVVGSWQGIHVLMQWFDAAR
jgi:hypothetical protein